MRSIPCFVESLESRLLFDGEKVLFIRGASGTGGFIDGGSLAQRDDQLADIHNFSTASTNHGWGELANLLRDDGFAPEQKIEPKGGRLRLDAIDLSQYATIVFGSNNGDYTPFGSRTIVDALVRYVFAGGSALFVSDGNFGSTYGDAPSSDQDFLGRFGLAINQDRGTYSVTREVHFRQPDHPILDGVNTIDGEGISPGVRVSPIPGVTPQVLINAQSPTRNNDNDAKGTDRNVTEDDGALVIATAGLGRIAIHFDRNTFFNRNGVGTSLHRFDNMQYARNLFTWLAGRTNGRPQVHAIDFQNNTLRVSFNRYVARDLSTADIRLINRKTGNRALISSVGFEQETNTAVFKLRNPLGSGNFRATILGDGITDSKGKPLPGNVVYNFHNGS